MRRTSAVAGLLLTGLLCLAKAGPSPTSRPESHSTSQPASQPGQPDGKTVQLKDVAEFNRVISKSDKPVLVDFYKGGCPTCAKLDPIMDKLAGEYRGKVAVAKFMLMTATFNVAAPEIKERYDVSFYPTVILFVNGSEWKGATPARFVMDREIDDYRQAMNAAAGGPASQPAAGE